MKGKKNSQENSWQVSRKITLHVELQTIRFDADLVGCLPYY